MPIDGNSEKSVLAKVLSELMDEEGVTADEIVLLTTRSDKTSSYKHLEKIGKWALTWDERKPHFILISSIQSFKGLESPIIVLVETTDLARHKDSDVLVYIASTRARYLLIVIGALPSALTDSPF